MHGLSAITNGENTILERISVEKDKICIFDLYVCNVPIDNRHKLNTVSQAIYELLLMKLSIY